jgi:hypothetical protein
MWWLVLGVPVLLLLASVLVLSFVLGDHFVQGLKVEDRTTRDVESHEVLETNDTDDIEVLEAEVPPHPDVITTVECGSSLMVAKVRGSVVARRGPLPECNIRIG